MSDLTIRAERYATEVRTRINHLRKYTNQPYQVHLKAVAERVARVTDDDEVIVRSFARDQVVSGDAMLSEVIGVLTRHHYCFVRMLGQITGVIARGDLQKPIARMTRRMELGLRGEAK
ncbi:MAG: hypothetical protein JJE42_13945 [Burkholderiales bacterium]|nr:hypothetical protein [Burkholderiales bacterium]